MTRRLFAIEPYVSMEEHGRAVSRFVRRIKRLEAKGWRWVKGELRFLPEPGNHYRIECDLDKP